MKKFFDVLKKCSLFSGIEDKELVSFLECLDVKVKSYNKNEMIADMGDEPSDIGIILSGKAQIIRTDYMGNRNILSEVMPGETFLEAFSCAEVKEIPVSVVADMPCEIMLVDCKKIMNPCCNGCGFHSKVIFNLMKNMAEKNIMFYQKIQVITKKTTREKLMEYLMFTSVKKGTQSFDISFDRQELADYLGVDRSGLSAEISKLREEGIIKSRKNHFVIL